MTVDWICFVLGVARKSLGVFDEGVVEGGEGGEDFLQKNDWKQLELMENQLRFLARLDHRLVLEMNSE
jgi:hypothetical protein